jgi:hypothetical protein
MAVPQVDLSALSTAQLTAVSLANVIMVDPQKNRGIDPIMKAGTTGKFESQKFLFNYEGEQSITLQSDITDHFTEDNTALQDQIALKPTVITTHGFIAELNDISPEALTPLKTIAEKLQVLDAFTPSLSATALIAYNNALQAYQTSQLIASSAVASWSTGKTQNKQQIAFQKFFGWFKSRQLFVVQTPWAVFNNMAIASIRAMQDEDTRVISSFEISFKAMHFAQTITSSGIPVLFQGRSIHQSAEIVEQGATTGIDAVLSAANSIKTAFGTSLGIIA